MELKCVNKNCLYEWDYRGKIREEKKLITCPKCHYRNPLGKLKENLINYKNPLTHTTHSYHSLIPLTQIQEKKDYIEVEEDILVEKSIAKQFIEAPEDLDDDEEEIKEIPKVEEKIFNVDKDQEWKDMPIEVSNPFAEDGKRTKIIKVRDIKNNLIESIKVKNSLSNHIKEEIKRNEIEEQNKIPHKEPEFEITPIPHDPIKILEHQRNYY